MGLVDHLTPIEKLARGMHGFPVPDLKTWNFIVRMLLTDHPPEYFRGSVEDIRDEQCLGCDGELIRQDIPDFDPRQIFAVGLVYCPRSVKTHPAYWFEVWPFAGKYNPRDEERREENNARLFRSSSPTIKKCYSGQDIFKDRFRQLRSGKQANRRILPNSPSYVHG